MVALDLEMQRCVETSWKGTGKVQKYNIKIVGTKCLGIKNQVKGEKRNFLTQSFEILKCS